MVSVGTGKKPESPLGSTDLLQNKSWFNLLEINQKAKNILFVFGSVVSCLLHDKQKDFWKK